MMLKTQEPEGSFHNDVVRMLFQTLMMEFLMLVERRMGSASSTDDIQDESDCSPLDLIHETTINNIRQQLRYSNKTVKEICSELDFPNLSFFGKFVREHLGMSPKEYRQ